MSQPVNDQATSADNCAVSVPPAHLAGLLRLHDEWLAKNKPEHRRVMQESRDEIAAALEAAKDERGI